MNLERLNGLGKAFLVSMAVLTGASIAHAEDKKLPVPPDRNKYQSRSNPLLEATNLREAVQLPDVPEFTGKLRFILGSVHQAKTGPNYLMKFHTKEDAKTVIDWYRNTLQMYKWKIMSSDHMTVQASNKDGSTIFVLANELGAPKNGERTQLEINYFQASR